jgi:hypothetical protein
MTAPARPRDRVLQRLELVCQELGPALISEVILVGGSLQAVLPLEVPNRPTKDVDFILPTPTRLRPIPGGVCANAMFVFARTSVSPKQLLQFENQDRSNENIATRLGHLSSTAYPTFHWP